MTQRLTNRSVVLLRELGPLHRSRLLNQCTANAAAFTTIEAARILLKSRRISVDSRASTSRRCMHKPVLSVGLTGSVGQLPSVGLTDLHGVIVKVQQTDFYGVIVKVQQTTYWEGLCHGKHMLGCWT
jgi:hypothetical protein